MACAVKYAQKKKAANNLKTLKFYNHVLSIMYRELAKNTFCTSHSEGKVKVFLLAYMKS